MHQDNNDFKDSGLYTYVSVYVSIKEKRSYLYTKDCKSIFLLLDGFLISLSVVP